MAETQTEKKTGDNRKNKIAGFVVDKLDRNEMVKYIEEKGVDIDTEELSTEQLGVSLFSHFTNNFEDDDLVKCDSCLGVSDKDADCCPYCGDEGGEEDEEETAEASDVEEEEEEVETKSSKKKDEEEPEEEEETTDSEDEDEEEEETEEEEEEKPAPKKSAKKDEEEEEEQEEKEETEDSEDEEEEEDDNEEEETETEEEEVAAKPAKKEKKNMSTAIETNGVSKKKLATTKDLDKAVARVIELKSEGAENYWRLGRELGDINKRHLWKFRLDDDGKPKYKSWESFVSAELGMTPQHAYRAIECGKNYDTPDEVRELGHTKAVLILQAAPEDRAKLKKKAKAGATKRELEEDVKESRKKHGSPKKDSPKAKAGAKGGASKAKKTAAVAEKISIANIEGIKTIKLYAKPELRGRGTFSIEDLKELDQATSLKDIPFGGQELTNNVVQYFSVLQKDGHLYLKIQTTRAKPAAESEE